jgi:hypothetical protein
MAAKSSAKKPAKKPATKAKGAKPRKQPKTRSRGSGKKAGDGAAASVPRGSKGLTNAEKSLRDTLIVQRVAQGWTWREISDEVGLSISQCKRAHKSKKQVMSDLLDMDPVEIVKRVIEGFEASIGDLEKMAFEYGASHPSAAVGAKKGADEARRNLIILLQSIGVLPHELGTLRYVREVRVIVDLLVESVDRFEKRVGAIEMPPKHRKEVRKAADELRSSLKEAAGGESDR